MLFYFYLKPTLSTLRGLIFTRTNFRENFFFFSFSPELFFTKKPTSNISRELNLVVSF